MLNNITNISIDQVKNIEMAMHIGNLVQINDNYFYLFQFIYESVNADTVDTD